MVARASFETLVGEIPFAPTSEQGTGFIAPFSRAISHLLIVASLLNEDEAEKHPSSTEIRSELDSARTHLDAIAIDSGFSTNFTEAYNKTILALEAARREISAWDETTTKDNLIKLTNRFLQLSANLDREVLGIRTADPGFSL